MEIYGDEAGNLDFGPQGTKYFIVATIGTDDPTLAHDMLALRRKLHVQGHDLTSGFHAAEDRQAVRDEVFGLLAGRALRADATAFLKSKVHDRIRARADFKDYFYKLAWFYHHRYVLPIVARNGEQPFVAISSLDTKKRRKLHAEALAEVVNQTLPGKSARLAHWPAESHPCLQAADYYTWAVQRWLERGDRRSYDLVQHQFGTVYRIWE